MKSQWVAFRSRLLDLRIAGKSEKNVTVRTKHHGFDEFIYLLDLTNFNDYRISILTMEIVAYTSVSFLLIFLEKDVCE